MGKEPLPSLCILARERAQEATTLSLAVGGHWVFWRVKSGGLLGAPLAETSQVPIRGGIGTKGDCDGVGLSSVIHSFLCSEPRTLRGL